MSLFSNMVNDPKLPGLPVGTLTGDALEKAFLNSIAFHEQEFIRHFTPYTTNSLFHGWRRLLRSIEEMINIPLEVSNDFDYKGLMTLNLDSRNSKSQEQFLRIISGLRKEFGEHVALRFRQLTMMTYAINGAYEMTGYYDLVGRGYNFSNVAQSINYFQSRRAYYTATAGLISSLNGGTRRHAFMDTLNLFQYPLDSCLINITNAYFHLLINESLPDYEVYSQGHTCSSNFDYNHLEDFFLEPQKLSVMDQMEHRPDQVGARQLLAKKSNLIFSFAEVASTMMLFQSVFVKYELDKTKQFRQVNQLLQRIAVYIVDDYDIEIGEKVFKSITADLPDLSLVQDTSSYFSILNSTEPFIFFQDTYYSTVNALNRFIIHLFSKILSRNRSYQINSGFIFENKVQGILEENGFTVQEKVKRIEHKEFDLITRKGGIIYNFQCKNNFLDVSSVSMQYKKIGRLNRYLCRSYLRA